MNKVVTETKIDFPVEGGSTATAQRPYFFTPSTLKFVLMSVCTFGIYELYWFYKNWTLMTYGK